MIDDALLADASFELLASSSIRRYVREAHRLATSSGLVEELRSGGRSLEHAHDRVVKLLEECESSRSPAEFEAAILLSALTRAASQDARDLLVKASSTASAWIRALGLRLLRLAPPSLGDIELLQQRISPLLEGPAVIGQATEWVDRSEPDVFPRAA